MKKTVFLTLVFLPLLSAVFGSQLVASPRSQYSHLTFRESEIIARINGTNAYKYDLELEKLALNHSISNHAFRSAGSTGASEAAQWTKKQFESFGLEANIEPFEFTNWNLLTQPVLVIDDDGNVSSPSDQKIIRSFQSTHYSWPTPEGGVFRDLVILPLPEARNINATQRRFLISTLWNAINTTGKIVLTGRELRWNRFLRQAYVNKLRSQPPAAIIYTWWYEWMSFTPPMFGSIGGRPVSFWGPYYWDLEVPVGWVSYEDGLWIRNRESNVNVSASLTIPAVIKSGPHYNVVGKLKGSVNAEKIVIISGHYDTVMTSGFCDNGAGTAGVIELARVFANAAKEGLYNPEQTLLFIAFASEELGLIGSINYIRQHKAEMKNISAVINLDCIGSDALHVTETFPNDDGLDLDEIVLRAAEDLGVRAELEDPGGSDQEAFRSPMMADILYDRYWGLDADISNATRVKASTMLCSYPLFYSDIWENGTPGWIHTQYDNSTSTSTLNWVEVDDLEVHIQVAALSAMRIQSYISSPFTSEIITVTVVASIIVVAAVYFERSRVNMALKKTYDSIRYYIEMRELVFIVMLTALFLFISFVAHTKIGKIEVIVRGFPNSIIVAYYGYPFEMIGIENLAQSTLGHFEETSPLEWVESYQVGTLILWDGIFLNIVLYFLLAFGLTYLVARLRYMYIIRKSE